jgi:hypothetical protein
MGGQSSCHIFFLKKYTLLYMMLRLSRAEALYHNESAFYTRAGHCSQPNNIHNAYHKTGRAVVHFSVLSLHLLFFPLQLSLGGRSSRVAGTASRWREGCRIGTGGGWRRTSSKESAPAIGVESVPLQRARAGRTVVMPCLGVPRGISAVRSTELNHGGAREAGSSNGGVELGAATTSSWAVVASNSVMQGRFRR